MFFSRSNAEWNLSANESRFVMSCLLWLALRCTGNLDDFSLLKGYKIKISHLRYFQTCKIKCSHVTKCSFYLFSDKHGAQVTRTYRLRKVAGRRALCTNLIFKHIARIIARQITIFWTSKLDQKLLPGKFLLRRNEAFL